VKVAGLDHIQVSIPKGGEESARGFYGGLLGLVEVTKPQTLATRGGCWFSGPGVDLHLGVEADFRPARKAHIAVVVTDPAAARRELESAGVTTVADEADIGVERFYAEDPFGNRLEFVAEADSGFTRRFTRL